ncbi:MULTISPECIES: hypothetical protein [unclassified Cupriavidus]|uniref:hypothetical protein n=1 Tax=unclassified Cupriavidus TaxID=2640874 RepID=UPI00313CE3CB
MTIPESEQIEAILSGQVWNLVHRYCEGAWSRLPMCWTASFAAIISEARRRGLECFVTAKPKAEGYWLIQTETGYATVYWERGISMYRKEFSQLEQAFDAWLEQEMSSQQLPIRR